MSLNQEPFKQCLAGLLAVFDWAGLGCTVLGWPGPGGILLGWAELLDVKSRHKNAYKLAVFLFNLVSTAISR